MSDKYKYIVTVPYIFIRVLQIYKYFWKIIIFITKMIYAYIRVSTDKQTNTSRRR